MIKKWLSAVLLIAIGLFWAYVPTQLLTEDILPDRYKRLHILGLIFSYIGIIALVRNLFLIRRWILDMRKHA